MRVMIYTDEIYPVYVVERGISRRKYMTEVEIPESQLDWINHVWREWWQMQNYLESARRSKELMQQGEDKN